MKSYIGLYLFTFICFCFPRNTHTTLHIIAIIQDSTVCHSTARSKGHILLESLNCALPL